MKKETMHSVREYVEELPVEIIKIGDRFVIQAENEGGYNITQVDLFDLLEWLKQNRPELLLDK